MGYLLAIDEGTTGSKAFLTDENLNVVAEASEEFPQHFPKPSWVEHNLEEIWKATRNSVKKATAKINPKEILAIGITNQRETVCFWEKSTGKPVANAIVWQDRRTSSFCEELKSKGTERFFQENTGLVIDPYFSGTKVTWAFENWPDVKRTYQSGNLAVGTIDSFLIARLAGGGTHVTEPSNASRTLCFHLTNHKWDPDLCSALSIPTEIWPDVLPSTGKFAVTAGLDFLPDGIPITGVLGDQQAALLGQACIDVGTAKCTYGTGAFLLMNTGDRPAKSRHQLVSTIAWALDSSRYTYALEGSAFIAGAAVQWARDGLKMISDSSEIEKLAGSVKSTDGVTFVPSLTGLGAPYWNPRATGLMTGITRGTTNGHLARAILEGIAFQNADILVAMEKDFGKPLQSLNVDGGAAANNLLIQFQSDILDVELRRPVITQTTSLGAIFAAGLGAGIWTELSDVKKTWKQEKLFKPEMPKPDRENHLKRWERAVRQASIVD